MAKVAQITHGNARFYIAPKAKFQDKKNLAPIVELYPGDLLITPNNSLLIKDSKTVFSLSDARSGFVIHKFHFFYVTVNQLVTQAGAVYSSDDLLKMNPIDFSQTTSV